MAIDVMIRVAGKGSGSIVGVGSEPLIGVGDGELSGRSGRPEPT